MTVTKTSGWAGRAYGRLAGMIVALLVAWLLGACGENPQTSLRLPTVPPSAQPGGALVPAEDPTVTVSASATPALPVLSVTTPVPAATPEPPTPTPTLELPTATPEPPTPPAQPRPTVNDTAPGPNRRATPTIQPASEGQPAPVDAAVELKIIKAGYDALNKNYYTQPDTAVVAQKALQEVAVALGVSLPATPKWSTPEANWKLFEERFNSMVAASSQQLPPRVLAHRAITAMAAAVGDLHTYFLDERRTEAWERTGRGDNTVPGFGIFLVNYQNGYYVQRLTTGGPGQVAGVKIGDKLVRFDGAEVSAANIAAFSRAQEGKQYQFGFERPGQTARLTLNIEFKRHTIPTAEWRMVNNKIGFITLNAFHRDVEQRLDEAIAAVKAQGAESVIIDLRFNGGGYNFEKVSGRFVKNGEVLGKFINRSSTTALKASSDGRQVDPPLPLAVLIDRNSASASEVFSLAVRDYKVGTLVGGKSIGAIGTVRAWPLGDGTMLAVTNSVYETVNGEKLNGVGVTPDIQVARTTADILVGRDPQLDAAIKHLETKARNQP